MRVVIPYKTKHLLELPARVRGISPYDLESVVLDAPLQPRITLGSLTAGEILSGVEGVVVGGRVVRGGEGFPHREYGLAIKRVVGGYEVHTRDSVKVCEEVVCAGTEGAFLAACYTGKHTSIYLASFTGLLSHENAYRARPVRASVGFQSGSVVFADGRSVILYQGRFSEVGMPVDAVAFLEGVFYGRSNEWVVAVDTHSSEVKPCTKAGRARFAGFLSGLPVFHDGKSFYVLDGGSLIKRGFAVGYVTAWGDTIVDDEGGRLVLMDAYGKPVAEVLKDSSAACRASKQGVACFRGNLIGIVDFSERSVVEVRTAGPEEHAVEVSADTPVWVVRDGVEHRVREGQKVLVVDEGASVLRDCLLNLTVKHLIGDEQAYVKSPARRVRLRVKEAKLLTSSATHECGGFSVLMLEGVEVEKPSRVALEVGGKPLAREVCLEKPELEEVLVEAVDSVTGDRLEVARLKPSVERVPKPQVVLSVRHDSSKSVLTLVSDGEVVGARLCCGRVCRELPVRSEASSFEVRDCRLPAWVEVTTRRRGFLYQERIDVSVPGLADAVLSTDKTSEFRVGGFHTTIPVPDYPDIPPIHRVRARILPNKLVITLSSRVVGRGVIMAGGRLRPVVLKDGENTLEAPFDNNVLLLVDAGRRWVYRVELSPELLIKAARRHAEALKQVLGFE